MITYSKKLLKNFKLLKDNNIPRKQAVVVLNINDKSYADLSRIHNKKRSMIAKYTSASKWIKLFNEGNDIFKIISKYPEITSVSTLETFFKNQLVALELNKSYKKSCKEFVEWFTDLYVTKGIKLEDIAEEYGYTARALKSACNKFDIRRSRIKYKRPVGERKYVTIGRTPKEYINNANDMKTIGEALEILIKTNSAKELYNKLNISPRLAKRLHSDYNIFRADKIPFKRIMRLLAEKRLTLREIDHELKCGGR